MLITNHYSHLIESIVIGKWQELFTITSWAKYNYILKKTILVIILVFLSFDSTCQKITLLKTWINENNEALIITDSCLYYQDYNRLSKYDYKTVKDTLFMIEYRYSHTKEFPRFEDYRIIKLNVDTLILEYNKKWMGERTKEIKRILFIDSVKIKSKIENLSKFLVQKTYFDGTTVRTKLEIDSIGNVYFWDKNDSLKIYYLKLSKNSLDTFKNCLYVARIENNDSVRLGGSIDKANYIFTLSYNKWKIRKSLNRIPYLNWELSNILYFITKKIKNEGLIINNYNFLE